MPNVLNRRAKNWCGTFFHKDEEEQKDFHSRLEEGVGGGKIKYAIYGVEKAPTTGRLHLQWFVQFTRQLRGRTVRNYFAPFEVHLIVANGTPGENRAYCSKDGVSFEFGEFSATTQGQRTDLETIRDEIKEGISETDLAEQHFGAWVIHRRAFREYRNLLRRGSDRTTLRVCCLYGEAGVGKTRFARQYGTEAGGVWLSSCPELRWFDGYNGEETVILDDFRGGCPFQQLLRILDIYALDVPIKGGFVPWNPLLIFITSNLAPSDWYTGLTEYSTNALTRRVHKSVCIRSMEEFFGSGTVSWDEQYRIIKNKLELD